MKSRLLVWGSNAKMEHSEVLIYLSMTSHMLTKSLHYDFSERPRGPLRKFPFISIS